MTEAERLAAIWEAADEAGDDALVLSVLFSMRDPAMREDLRDFLAAPQATRTALRSVLRRSARDEPANAEG